MKLIFINYDLAKKQLKFKTEDDATLKIAQRRLYEDQIAIEIEKFLTWHLHRYFGMNVSSEEGKDKKTFTLEQCDPISFLLESKIAFLRVGVTEENWAEFENAVREAHIAARINEEATRLNFVLPLTKDNFEKLNEAIRERYPEALSGMADDVWGKIYSYVSKQDRNSMLFVNKQMNRGIDKYRRLLEIHFPHVLEKLSQKLLKMSEEEKKLAQTKKPNYKKIFETAELYEYWYMSSRDRDMMRAFKEGDLEEMERYNLSVRDLWSLEDSFHRGPLYWARKNKRQSVLEYCYNKMTHWLEWPEQEDSHQLTPLHWAIMCGKSVDDIERLVPPADIHAVALQGFKPLHTAAYVGRLDIVQYLCGKLGAQELNAVTKKGSTALMIAVNNGEMDIVEYLCKQEKIEINAQNNRGETALMVAAEGGHLGMVKCLCKKTNIKINEVNIDGKTALMYACEKGHLDVVKHLCVRPGIEINAAAESGTTAFMFAVEHEHLDIVKYLCAQPQILNEHLSGTKRISEEIHDKIRTSVKQWLASNKDKPGSHVLKLLIGFFYSPGQTMWESGASHAKDAFLIANMLIEENNNPATFSARVEPYLENAAIPDSLKGIIRQVLDNARHSANEEKPEHKI